MTLKALLAALILVLAHAIAPLAAFAPISAFANENGASAYVENQAGKVRLISAQSSAAGKEVLALGLEFQMNPGWKIYWRTPGDAGFPPSFDWSGSKNLESAEIAWPAPTRFELAGLQNYGYGGHVVLPILAKLADPMADSRFDVLVDYLICQKICVPAQAQLSLSVPAGGNAASGQSGPASTSFAPTPFAHDIARFQSLVPPMGNELGLKLEKFEFQTNPSPFIRFEVLGRSWHMPDAFVEPDQVASFDAPRIRVSGDTLLVEMPIPPYGLKDDLAQSLTITLTDRPNKDAPEPDFAAQFVAVPDLSQSGPTLSSADMAFGDASQSTGPSALALMMLTAILGGLILNVMPCVLPVLGIKVLGVVSQAGAAKSHARLAFLMAALGILASFWVLAMGAIALKSAGLAVGWGIQFQQPWFLVALIVLVLGFAANLFGLFEINLPGGLASKLPQGQHHSLKAHFLSGAFATLLATPCSAPFLGTAIGFALSRGSFEIVAIFSALGLGMALPFLALAAAPALAGFLPKPGPWMIRVRQAMGVALVATALWLGFVLVSQIRTDTPAATTTASHWQEFDETAIPTLIAQGKVVFVDVTADWCITCKVNKAAVLDRAEVAEALTQVIAMRADWTKPDAKIAAFLERFGRYGIPFNVVYGPNAPQGIVLSEFLTNGEVLNALAAAK